MVDSKFVANLGPLTDDKGAFRQWDANMVNALNHLKAGYDKTIEKLKELIPRQQIPVKIQACIGVKPVASSQISPMRKDVLAKCYGAYHALLLL